MPGRALAGGGCVIVLITVPILMLGLALCILDLGNSSTLPRLIVWIHLLVKFGV